MGMVQNTFLQLVSDRNQVLNNAGIHASYFTGYFAREVTRYGCEIYVSASDEKDIDAIKVKLRTFLDSQPPVPTLPGFTDEPMRA